MSSARLVHDRTAPRANLADLLALPASPPFELIEGALVEKAAPGFGHGDAQLALAERLRPPFHRRGGGSGGPGGWWIVAEVEVVLDEANVLRPDLTGWRRERLPERPVERPVRVRPDWVCEILSPSNRRNDLIAKLRTYHRCGVPHYWVVDPEEQTLTVYRWTADGYLTALTAQRGERVRAEPFEALEWPVGALFGDEPEEK